MKYSLYMIQCMDIKCSGKVFSKLYASGITKIWIKVESMSFTPDSSLGLVGRYFPQLQLRFTASQSPLSDIQLIWTK